MIKPDSCEACRCVAIVAIGRGAHVTRWLAWSDATIVAGAALRGCGLNRRCDVARLAGHRTVGAGQWEGRLVVIKGLGPANRRKPNGHAKAEYNHQHVQC